jgi:hypothetical protein
LDVDKVKKKRTGGKRKKRESAFVSLLDMDQSVHTAKSTSNLTSNGMKCHKI